MLGSWILQDQSNINEEGSLPDKLQNNGYWNCGRLLTKLHIILKHSSCRILQTWPELYSTMSWQHGLIRWLKRKLIMIYRLKFKKFIQNTKHTVLISEVDLSHCGYDYCVLLPCIIRLHLMHSPLNGTSESTFVLCAVWNALLYSQHFCQQV